MPYIVEAPIEAPHPHYPGDTETVRVTHPAYAVIGASRITSSEGCVLFGSDFRHQASVKITLNRASLHRTRGGSDMELTGDELFCVEMSEAQWARFVSATNTGGARCTLQHVQGERVPQIAEPVDRRSQFSKDSASTSQLVLDSIREAREAVQQSGLSQKKQKEILDKLHTAEMNAGTNQEYVADQFARHMERTVQHAGIEIDAMVASAVRQVGLDAVRERALTSPILPMLERAER